VSETSSLKYVGKAADSDFSISSKQTVDDRFATTGVNQAYVNSAVAAQTGVLALKTYVDTQDNTKAKKTAVDTADNGYLLATARGAASGIASLGADNLVPAAQVPTSIPDRSIVVAATGTQYLSGTQGVSSTTTKTYRAASLTVPDPGWPYVMFSFATLRGFASAAGNWGQGVILDPSNNGWTGVGVTGDNTNIQSYQVMPYAAAAQAAYGLSGGRTLELWLSLYSGSGTFYFQSTGFIFYALLLPSL